MDQQRLGEYLAVFEVKRGVLTGAILFWAFSCCLGAFLMAGAAIVPVNPRANPLVHYGLFLTLGAFLLLSSAYLLFKAIRHIGLRVSFHSDGLVIVRGGGISVLPWNEIEVVWHREQGGNLGFEDYLGSILDGSQSVYTLLGRSGERFVLDSFLGCLETLGWAIQRETTRRLLAQSLRSYEVEGHVEFGRLAVGREGLSKGSKMLPWSDVGGVVVQNGFVFVKKRNGKLAWVGVRMGKVPNLYVYLALVETSLNSRREPSPR
jgi:hypothetical protein